jgi:hypothetical protein
LEGDSPITNFSSEYNDGVDYPGRKFPPFPPYDPGITPWAAEACSGMFKCTSYISQEDADDCAAALAAACTLTPHPPTDPTPFCVSNPSACLPYTPGLYTNDLRTASFVCPDGTVFTWDIRAGTIISSSKSLANSIAQELANKRVIDHSVCLSDIPNSGCVGTTYSGIIIATGSDIYTLSVTSGFTPYGMSVTNGFNSIKIEGEASSAGAFFFTVRATGTVTGATATKNYVVSVIGISPNTLPDATILTPYSQTIIVSGGAPPVSLTVSSGALPDGLTLSLAGLISGTPTSSGAFYFDVKATDSVGGTCVKSYSITVPCSIITASPLANGATGMAYSQTIAIVGGGAAVWSVIGGALPSGLSLDSSSGVISGTPDTAGLVSFTIQALKNEITCAKSFSIEIGLMSKIIWVAPTIVLFDQSGPPNTHSTASYTQSDYGYSQKTTCLQVNNSLDSGAKIEFSGTMNYFGPAITGRLKISVPTVYGIAFERAELIVNGSTFAQRNYIYNSPTTGVSLDDTWAIPSMGIGGVITFFARIDTKSLGLNDGGGEMSGTFSIV